MFCAASASGSGTLFCLFEGSALSIKRRELGLGTTSLSPSFLSPIPLPHGSEIIHPPTDRCCVGGRCQSAKSTRCKGYACPLFCSCVPESTFASVFVWELCVLFWRVFFFFLWAASICLDVVLNQSVHIWGWEESAMCFIHILFFSFTCCHLSSSLPFRKQYLHTARAVSRLPPSPLRQRVISLCLYPSFLSLPSPSRSLRQAYEHRRSVKKLAVRHIPSLPSPWSPPLLLFHPTACSPLHLPFPSLPPSPILLSLLLPPLCLVAPLIHYISSPLLRPLLTPSSFFSAS